MNAKQRLQAISEAVATLGTNLTRDDLNPLQLVQSMGVAADTAMPYVRDVFAVELAATAIKYPFDSNIDGTENGKVWKNRIKYPTFAYIDDKFTVTGGQTCEGMWVLDRQAPTKTYPLGRYEFGTKTKSVHTAIKRIWKDRPDMLETITSWRDADTIYQDILKAAKAAEQTPEQAAEEACKKELEGYVRSPSATVPDDVLKQLIAHQIAYAKLLKKSGLYVKKAS